MYKLANLSSPPTTNRVFKLNSDSHYNFRQILQFSRSLVKSIYYRTESISYLGPKIWDILPDDYIHLKLKLKNVNQKLPM